MRTFTRSSGVKRKALKTSQEGGRMSWLARSRARNCIRLCQYGSRVCGDSAWSHEAGRSSGSGNPHPSGVLDSSKDEGVAFFRVILSTRWQAVPFEALADIAPVRIDLLQGRPEVGQAHTTEKDLRATPDRQIERAVIAFYRSATEAQAARSKYAPAGEIFALRHSMSKGDLLIS